MKSVSHMDPSTPKMTSIDETDATCEKHLSSDEISFLPEANAFRSKPQNLQENNSFQTWLCALSEERFAEAMIIRDDTFVATILDLHSSSSSSSRLLPSPKQVSIGSTEQTAALLFPVEEAESTYRRFAQAMHRNGKFEVLTVNSNMGSSSIDDRSSANTSIFTINQRSTKAAPTPDAPYEGKTPSNIEPLVSISSSNEKVDDLRSNNTRSADVFRIQDEAYRIHSLATHANLLFPSVIDFIMKQRGSSSSFTTRNAMPLITFDVSSVTVHSLSNILYRCLQEYEKFSCTSTENFWTFWLRQRFCHDSKVSLSDLLLTRAEVALVVTYKALSTSADNRRVHGDYRVNQTNNAVAVGDLHDDNNAVRIPNVPSGGMVSHDKYVVDADMKSILKDIVAFAQELRHFAKQEDLQKLKLAFSGIVNSRDQLPFVPLMEMIKASEGQKNVTKQAGDLNDMLENILRSVMARAEKSGFMLQSDVVANVMEVDIDLGESRNHMSVIGMAKKRKKKKKSTKKRKSSIIEKLNNPLKPTKNVAVSFENAPVEVEEEAPEVSEMTDIDDFEATIQKVHNQEENKKVEQPIHPVSDSYDSACHLPFTSTGTETLSTSICDDISRLVNSELSLLEGTGNIGIAAPHLSAPPKVSVMTGNNGVPEYGKNSEEEIWETVEAKAKGRSRRNGDQKPSSTGVCTFSSNRRNKNIRTAVSRKHNQSRKIVKDIILTVLDVVEDEVKGRERKLGQSNKSAEERRHNIEVMTQRDRKMESTAKSNQIIDSNPTTLRDIVLGRKNPKPLTASNPSRYANTDCATIVTKDLKSNGKLSPQATPFRQHMNSPADQNTANTVPETLSGTSANTQSSINTDSETTAFEAYMKSRLPVEEPILGDSISDGIEDEKWQKPVPEAKKAGYPSPPLQTLLGPGNTNSASSSVASSLDPPHASNHRHHHHCAGNENDVGYHLLDVCGRLSQDMDVFMARRADALSARRKERGALLSALQETVNNIWAGSAHVEMYGSCATQLDLPSSDLDAVIRGLDTPEFVMTQSSQGRTTPTTSPKRNKHSRRIPSIRSTPKEFNYQNDFQSHGSHPSPYIRMTTTSVNGDRVLRLAGELERQPWAVQVKAIPTASVPVIKILADPSRLPGALFPVGGDWMMQQHHLATQTVSVTDINVPLPPNEPLFVPRNGTSMGISQTQYPPHSPPWRGADVMNGLFSVDITFEGPEHGGIGSTAFSARVVQDACNETGLPPDRTPAVQVLMVLKELLAQRRLNEPFSGGLSSYALLLLVVAVMKERSAIREEMERIEGHRRGLSNGAANTSRIPISSSSKKELESTLEKERDRLQEMTQQKATTGSTEKGKIRHEASLSAIEGSSKRTDMGSSKPQLKVEELSATSPQNTTGISSEGGTKKVATTQLNRTIVGGASSWASIARKNTSNSSSSSLTQSAPVADLLPSVQSSEVSPKVPTKISSFAEAVSGRQPASMQTPKPVVMKDSTTKQLPLNMRTDKPAANNIATPKGGCVAIRPQKHPENEPVVNHISPHEDKFQQRSLSLPSNAPILPHFDSVTEIPLFHFSNSDAFLSGGFSMFPQGSNDVLEVLCSGETTAGKLLMHFLLFYGRYFDARTTSIDVSGKHHPDMSTPYLSPFIPRRSGGTIDSHTGMLTVDPIVIFDPWEGTDNNNVTRSCFAWSSIRWHFAQCYMTLSSAVERSGTPPSADSSNIPIMKTERAPEVDVVSPLLELLLSF